MNKIDAFLLFIFGVFLFVGLYGAYRLGHYYERKALTLALISQTEAIYYDGYGDAEKACRNRDIR